MALKCGQIAVHTQRGSAATSLPENPSVDPAPPRCLAAARDKSSGSMQGHSRAGLSGPSSGSKAFQVSFASGDARLQVCLQWASRSSSAWGVVVATSLFSPGTRGVAAVKMVCIQGWGVPRSHLNVAVSELMSLVFHAATTYHHELLGRGRPGGSLPQASFYPPGLPPQHALADPRHEAHALDGPSGQHDTPGPRR